MEPRAYLEFIDRLMSHPQVTRVYEFDKDGVRHVWPVLGKSDAGVKLELYKIFGDLLSAGFDCNFQVFAEGELERMPGWGAYVKSEEE